MPKVKVNEIEMYYEVKGEGPKLCFISGSYGDLRRTPNIFNSPLAERFKILAFDQRGLGQTSKPDKQYSMADYANDAAGLLDTLGWEIVPVMGVSFGGMVAQELAIRYPEMIEKLVIACSSTGGKGGASYPIHELNPNSPENVARRWIGVLDNRVNDSWIEENLEEYEERLRDFACMMEEIYGDEGSEKRIGVLRQLEARRHHDTYSRVHQIQVPKFICGGKYDSQAPPSNLENMHRLIPNSKLEFFEGGHGFLNQDEKAYKKIIEFLTM